MWHHALLCAVQPVKCVFRVGDVLLVLDCIFKRHIVVDGVNFIHDLICRRLIPAAVGCVQCLFRVCQLLLRAVWEQLLLLVCQLVKSVSGICNLLLLLFCVRFRHAFDGVDFFQGLGGLERIDGILKLLSLFFWHHALLLF